MHLHAALRTVWAWQVLAIMGPLAVVREHALSAKLKCWFALPALQEYVASLLLLRVLVELEPPFPSSFSPVYACQQSIRFANGEKGAEMERKCSAKCHV